MDAMLTIGRLASAAGVPISTVRYYERAGLLRPGRRSEGNFRLYDPGAVGRLRFIRSAQATGFTLCDVRSLLDFQDQKSSPCKDVQVLIEERLADLRTRIVQLSEFESALRTSLRTCRRSEPLKRCDVIKKLKETASSSRALSDRSRTPK
ncbi:MAG TPA: MerR family transcriptional regulator [Planctomycetota bacterium]|nr:MerR family transcriptional regulator [Planctomycetota bacterium]